MIEEEGIVAEVEGENARVLVLKKNACESCAAAGVCHPQDADRVVLIAANPLHATKGQKVKVALAPHIYLKRSVLIQYGVPVAALIFGAIIVKNLSIRYAGEANSDLWAFIAGVSCMLISFVLMRIYNNMLGKQPNYKPVIVELLS
jgi:positive regulator of sigma E activity